MVENGGFQSHMNGIFAKLQPLRFACPRTIGDFAHGLWQNLNPDNKVSLFARVIDLDSGETGDMIFNKYDAVNSDLDDPEEPELLPEELELLAAHEADCVRMPMRRGARCLNLSNAVAVGVYEALRQWDFAGLETHGQLTRYEWSEDVK